LPQAFICAPHVFCIPKGFCEAKPLCAAPAALHDEAALRTKGTLRGASRIDQPNLFLNLLVYASRNLIFKINQQKCGIKNRQFQHFAYLL
jgi:hypothetical protein